jgi:hypothetical protein
MSYNKNGITADAGPDLEVTLWQCTVNLDSSGSSSIGDPISQYLWSTSSGSIGPSWTPSQPGTYAVKLEALDSQGLGDSDTLFVTVNDPSQNYAKDFSHADFRGDLNGWGVTPMTLVDNYAWSIEVYVSPEESVNSQFKFYTSGRWYGDNERDGETHSNEYANCYLPSEPGFYRITLFDAERRYETQKL